jgi:hypothetical protein
MARQVGNWAGANNHTPHVKSLISYESPQTATDQDGCFGMPKHRKMDMRYGTQNVRSLYGTGLLRIVSKELGKCKLDLVGVKEVRWEKDGTEPAQDYILFYGEGNGDHQLGASFSYIRESYQRLGEWSLLVIGCRI